MDHYLDIRVEPDLELSGPVLINYVFSKLHRALAKHGLGKLGVSFPKQKTWLGDTIRIHGHRVDLVQLMQASWLNGLRDYTVVGEVTSVPDVILGYRTVYRVQKKTPHNLRKRAVKKGWLTEEEARHAIPDSKQPNLTLPYLQIKSLSNGNTMRLFIGLGDIQPEPTQGEFSSYGLSRHATVPWF